jgi:hypothetical protein
MSLAFADRSLNERFQPRAACIPLAGHAIEIGFRVFNTRLRERT